MFQNIFTLKFLYLESYNWTTVNFIYTTIFLKYTKKTKKIWCMIHFILNMLKFKCYVKLKLGHF